MQKQKKQLLVLVILLVIGILAYAGINFYNQKQEEKKAEEEEQNKITVTDFASEDVTGFSYLYEDTQLDFVKEDGTWYYAEDKSISIDGDLITSMLKQVAGLTAVSEVTDYESLADYGLKEPANTLTFQLKKGTVELLLGDKNDMLSQYYVKTKAGDTVYLVETSLDTVFGKSVSDLTKVEKTTETELMETETTEE